MTTLFWIVYSIVLGAAACAFVAFNAAIAFYWLGKLVVWTNIPILAPDFKLSAPEYILLGCTLSVTVVGGATLFYVIGQMLLGK